MAVILEVPELRQRVSHWSVDEYERLVGLGLAPKRGELIRGIIVDKMSKSPLYVDLTKFLHEHFLRQLPAGHSLFSEGPLRFIDSEPEPDLSVVEGTRTDFRSKHPTGALLVLEVAVGSVAADREHAFMYAEAKIPEYWIVLAEAKKIEVRRTPVAGVYQDLRVYGLGEELSCESVPELRVVLNELFE